MGGGLLYIKCSRLQSEHTKTWSAACKHNPVTCQSVTSWICTNNKQPHALMNLNETQTHFSKASLQEASGLILQHKENELDKVFVHIYQDLQET